MSKGMRLYPSRPIVGQDFSKCKVVTIPNQSMTLLQIIQRFVRKESLPVEHEGFYQEGAGDLEKQRREDLTVLHERAVSVYKSRAAAEAKAKADKDAASKAAFDKLVEDRVQERLRPPVVT